jgi:general secretion pathway protein H
MPISAAGNSDARVAAAAAMRPCARGGSGGFTLIELMVVITVIGLVSAIAMWAMPDPRGRVADEAARFALRARAAHDAAIVGARPVSLWVTPAGYGFDQRIAGGWSPIAEKPLRVERWSDGTSAQLGDDGARVRVTFDSTGLADRAATVTLTRNGAQAFVRIGADGSVSADAI